MLLRQLTAADAEALVPFVAMATSAPGREQPPDELATQVRQWVGGWTDRELGMGCADDGRLVGAAWARVVNRVLARDPDTGAPLPELIIAVAEHWRGAGLGGRLMDALMQRARTERIAGLVLTVSERNPVAVGLYEQAGFRHAGHTPSGLLTMICSTQRHAARRSPRHHRLPEDRPESRCRRATRLAGMQIGDLSEDAEADVLALWSAAGLTRPWSDPAADLRRALSGPSSTVLGAVLERRLIGTVMVGHDGHRGWVYHLAVAEHAQRQGVGRALMTAAETWLRQRGVPKLNVMVRGENTSVLRFYESGGFSKDDVVVFSRRLD